MSVFPHAPTYDHLLTALFAFPAKPCDFSLRTVIWSLGNGMINRFLDRSGKEEADVGQYGSSSIAWSCQLATFFNGLTLGRYLWICRNMWKMQVCIYKWKGRGMRENMRLVVTQCKTLCLLNFAWVAFLLADVVPPLKKLVAGVRAQLNLSNYIMLSQDTRDEFCGMTVGIKFLTITHVLDCCSLAKQQLIWKCIHSRQGSLKSPIVKEYFL